MREHNISLDTAHLARQKGADFFNVTMEATQFGPVFSEVECTQSLLQKWLRDYRNIQVYVWYDEDANYQCSFEIMGSNIYDKAFHFDTYEEALEYGLVEGIKLIK